MSNASDFVIKNGVLKKYKGNDEEIVIPDGVQTIGSYAFDWQTQPARIDIPNSVKKIEAWAFDSGRVNLEMSINCPFWSVPEDAKKYRVAQSIIRSPDSTLSFRDESGTIVAKVILATKDETKPKEDGFILSIRCTKKRKFDFAAYDSNFAVISKTPNKIKMATARLRYPYELAQYMEDVYLTYLKRHGAEAGTMLMDAGDIDTLHVLGEKRIFNATATRKMIEYAGTKQNAAITAWILEYNNTVFGGKSAAAPKLSLSVPKAAPADASDKPKMTVSDWRKIFKFKYAKGGVVITGYRGEDKLVTIPEVIGDKYVVGIDEFAWFGFRSTTVSIPEVSGLVDYCRRNGLKYTTYDRDPAIAERIREIKKQKSIKGAEKPWKKPKQGHICYRAIWEMRQL